jgi:N-acetyl-anhydromuramyl-L-alanine amidase AmpD
MKIIDVRNSLPKNPDPKRVWKFRKSRKITTIVVHQAACKGATTRGIAKYHTSPTEDRNNDGRIDAWEINHLSAKGSPAIAYHYTIERDGKVYKCNSTWEIVWHAGSNRMNKKSIGICVLGDFSGPDYDGREKPTKVQLKALVDLVDHLMISDIWDIKKEKVIGHCEVKSGRKKSCPGTNIMNTIKKAYRT